VILLCLSGCQSSALNAARTSWSAAGPQDYAYRVGVAGFGQQGSATVEVRGANVTVAQEIDPDAPSQPLPSSLVSGIPSLHDWIDQARATSDDVVEVYDAMGVPVTITIDPDRRADDDERVLSVRDFTAL
jgi:hypothetical protein